MRTILAVLFAFVVPATGSADIAPPRIVTPKRSTPPRPPPPCQGKKVGDACVPKGGGAGVCEEAPRLKESAPPGVLRCVAASPKPG